MITDQYSKLVRAVPLKNVTAASVAKAFAKNWILTFGLPQWLLSYNGKQFTARFFQPVCKILGVASFFTNTFHPQCNGQTERSNRTLLQALRHYDADHPRDCDLYADIFTYADSIHVYRATKCIPFDLILLRDPQVLAEASKSNVKTLHSASHFLLCCKEWLQCLLDRTSPDLRKAQGRHRRAFNKRVLVPVQRIQLGSLALVCRE